MLMFFFIAAISLSEGHTYEYVPKVGFHEHVIRKPVGGMQANGMGNGAEVWQANRTTKRRREIVLYRRDLFGHVEEEKILLSEDQEFPLTEIDGPYRLMTVFTYRRMWGLDEYDVKIRRIRTRQVVAWLTINKQGGL